MGSEIPATSRPVLAVLLVVLMLAGLAALPPAARLELPRALLESGSVALLVAGIAVVSMRFGREGLGAVLGATALCAAGLSIASHAPDVVVEPFGSDWSSRGFAGLLGLGVAMLPLPSKKRPWGAQFAAVLALIAGLTSIVMLSATPWLEFDTATAIGGIFRSLAALLLAAGIVDYLVFRRPGPRLGARDLQEPLVAAGCIAAAAAAWMTWEIAGSRSGWRALIAGASGFVPILFMLLGSGALTLSHSLAESEKRRDRKKRLLFRQRQLMLTRTRELRRSRSHYEELFRNVPVPVILADPSGRVISANPALLDLLGVATEREFKALNFATFYDDPADRNKLIAYWDASPESLHRGELRLRRRDGELLSVLYATRTVRAPDGSIEYLQGMMTDITELRRGEARRQTLESHLRLSQRLESVGRLAAGVAHEINTPMQYIGDNVYFLREAFDSLAELIEAQRRLIGTARRLRAGEVERQIEALDNESAAQDTLDAVPAAFDRTQEGIATVSRIVSAMKELAHPGSGGKSATDINALIDTALAVSRNEYKTVAEVVTELGDLPSVLAYKNELCQVVINLLVNAAHAIESAKTRGSASGEIRIATFRDGDSVCISVEDDGCGIPESALEKIFDPFFTTKDIGKGTGQGLAIARTAIVEKHGGKLDVESKVGVGTKFTIRLPTTAASQEDGLAQEGDESCQKSP